MDYITARAVNETPNGITNSKSPCQLPSPPPPKPGSPRPAQTWTPGAKDRSPARPRPKPGIEAASLNYRDLVIIKHGISPFRKPPLPPLTPHPSSQPPRNRHLRRRRRSNRHRRQSHHTLLSQDHQSGPISVASLATGLGGSLDGALWE